MYSDSMCVYAPESRHPVTGRQSYPTSTPRYWDESAFTAKEPFVSGFVWLIISSLNQTMKPTRCTDKVLCNFESVPISTLRFFWGFTVKFVPAKPSSPVVRFPNVGIPYPVDARIQCRYPSAGFQVNDISGA